MQKRSLRATLRATASFKFALGVGLGIAFNAPGGALANPSGGSVSTGAATITTPAAGQTQINQSSQGVVINWSSFNIATGETTKFVQPNANAIAVNRIGGASASQIQGSLLANGRIVLINPNGVAFGSHATVNVGSLIATTTGASDSDALAGRFTTSGNQSATISNQGSISASGFVALVAPHVSNSGTVTATLGDVSVGGANAFTIDMNGDGLVSFALPGTVTSGASVTNTGSLVGKNVMLSARAAQSAATGVITTTGVVQATGVSLVGGQIVLDGGSGAVNIGGTLKANGNTGGSINATGAAVGLTSATLDVSGTSGGGAIHLGGGGVASVDSHSTLNASATANGNGGAITIDASKNTVAGKALARGGASGGDGGLVSTNGNALTITGFTVDTSAPHGKTGTWLASAPSWSLGASAGTIQTNLATTNVALATNSSTGDIQVSSNLSWSGPNTLTLDASRNLSVTNNTTLADNGTGGVSLIAGNDLSLANKATIISGGPLSLLAGHDITLSNQATLKATGAANITLTAVHDISVAQQGGLSGAGAITLSSGDNISLANQASIADTGAGTIKLDAFQNISGSGQASLKSSGHGGIILHAGDANLAPPQASAAIATAAINTAKPNNNATGTITLSGSVQIIATGGGSVALYYNPTSQPTNFGSFVSVSGGGSVVAYQLIHTLAELQAISGNLSGSYALGNDIDASATAAWNSGAGFVPLGSAATPFTGNFDGQNFTIDSLTINLPTSTNVGLFGLIGAAGSVGNLAVLNATVTGGNNVGILAGENDGTVVHDASSGTVRGIDFTDDTFNGYYVGGLVGVNTGLVNYSASSASVTGFQSVGGLVGTDFSNGNTSSAITNSFATGNVAAVEDANEIAATTLSANFNFAGWAGGLLGSSGLDPVGLPANLAITVANDYATGNVTGDIYVGGLIGLFNNGIADKVYATGNVSGDSAGGADSEIGGLIGFMSNRAATPVVVSNAWASGNVTGTFDVGGLVGFSRSADLITNSHASGNVSGNIPGNAGNVGGLVGREWGNISNSYSTGTVSGDGNVGGLVGWLGYETDVGPNPSFYYMAGSVTNSWTSSTVSGPNAGAFIGRIQPGASGFGIATPSVSGAYYNSAVSVLPAFGGGDLSAASATGLSTSQMETASSFSFASQFGTLGSGKTWVIVDQDGSLNNAGGAAGGTMPMLLSEYSTNVVNAHQLQLMALDPSATYTLGGNINAGGTAGGDVWGTAGFIPVGGNNAGAYFTGTLEGNGNTINGLFINDTTTVVQYAGPTTQTYVGVETYGEVGLFGVIGAGGLVENINLTNVNVSGGDMMGVGALADGLFGTVENVSSSGSVHVGNGLVNVVGAGTNNDAGAGGLVSGVFTTGLIDNSSSSATVSGGNGSHIGGLAGAMVYGGTITSSHASGNVSTGGSLTGTNQFFPTAGGLVGIVFDLVGQLGTASLIDNSYATGNVSGELTGLGPVGVGGLVGMAGGGGLIENSYATGNVAVGMGHFINNQTIFPSQAGGFIGGLFIGTNNLSATVSNSYATGNVQGGSFSFVGGFVGYNSGTITDTYATGTLSGSPPAFYGFLGGFAGGNSGSIANSYTNSAVLSYPGAQGGFVAFPNGGTYSGDYWNLTTGIANPAQGAFGIANQPGITGLSDSQMRTASSYSFASEFGGLGSGATWAIVDLDGTINNAGGAAGGTTPMLIWQYSTTITNAHQLELMALNLSATYTLSGNIDVSGTSGRDVWGSGGFVPVGGTAAPFTGTFDGQGNSISNLTINRPTQTNVGLFGLVGTAGTVENLSLVNANVTGGNSVGILVGENDGTVVRDSSSGTVLGKDFTDDTNNGYYVGGLVGTNTSLVDYSESSATVTGFQDIGGLVGYDHSNGVTGSAITNSFATGNVALVEDANEINAANVTGVPAGFAGGLLGESGIDPIGLPANLAITVANDYATGNVTGDSFLGGLIGLINNGTVTNVYATGNVTGDPNGFSDADIGGLIGFISNRAAVPVVVSDAWASGNVSGAFNVGGLVGMERAADLITNAHASGNVSGDQPGASNIGGLIGQEHGILTNSYSTGTVTGGPGIINVGGLVGQLGYETNNGPNPAFFNTAGSITNSWTSSTVFGGGAVVAYIQTGASGLGIATPSVSGVYYNSDVSVLPAFGHGDLSAASATGLTTTQMQTVSSFSFASDFGALGSGKTWVIVDQDGSLNNAGGAAGGTMPMLLSEYSTNIVNAHQLQLMALDPAATYTIGNNINAGGTAGGDVWGAAGFIPVGGNNASASFTGTLSGNGNTIDGLFINDITTVVQYLGSTTLESYGEVGLFGTIGAGGLVENINLTNVNVSGGDVMGVGALADAVFGTVENATSSGSVHVGNGLVNVVSAGTNHAAGAGGLVGGVDNGGLVDNSSSSANVSGGNGTDIGGLAGVMVYGGTITNSHASGNVSTGSSITGTGQYETGTGGLVGLVFDLVGQVGTASLIDNSYATGTVSGQLTGLGPVGVGGLVGFAGGGGVIENSYATGNVAVGMGHFINNQTIFPSQAGGFIGGLFIGANNLSATVSNSYATGNVQGGSFSFVGGFVGYNSGTISDTYATGTVSGSPPAFYGFLGGFAGGNSGSISNSYTNSAVLSYPGAQGGFVAFPNGGTYSGDYWNLTTGIANPAQGAFGIANQSGITGLTTAQLQSGLPAGLDDGLWAINASINGGLPYLIALAP